MPVLTCEQHQEAPFPADAPRQDNRQERYLVLRDTTIIHSNMLTDPFKKPTKSFFVQFGRTRCCKHDGSDIILS
jgi:hypothetical protein